ncbi:hypothetical protein Misp01_33110 [Microtetraspora sp. NBRC 13810]|nr:hypothetical protein Misp01_33110 [Microtetraspora sp. NBRC 13810]
MLVGGGTAASAGPNVPGCGGAAATPVPASVPRVVSVAGDGFSSGEGAGGYTPGNGHSTFWRHQSPYAPGALAFAYLSASNRTTLPVALSEGSIRTSIDIDRLALAASSGAQGKHMMIDQVDVDAGTGRNIPQGNIIRPESNVVLLGFGAGDAHYTDVLQNALGTYISRATAALLRGVLPAPGWRNDQLRNFQAVLTREQNNLAEVQTQVTAALTAARRAAPNALIVLNLYPSPVKATGNPWLTFMGAQTLDALHGYVSALNARLRTAVTAFNAADPAKPAVEVFDPAPAVAGHEVGTAAPYFHAWTLNAAELRAGNNVHAFQESFMPNRAGHLAIGQSLARWLQARCPGLWAKAPQLSQVITRAQPGQAVPTERELQDGVLPNMARFCLSARQSRHCVSAEPGSAGTPVPDGYYPSPGSAIWDLWFGVWIAANSPTGSSDPISSGLGDASTPGRHDPLSCCGRSARRMPDGSGGCWLVEWGGDLNAYRYTQLPGSCYDYTPIPVYPEPQDPPPAGDVLEPPPSGVEPSGSPSGGGIDNVIDIWIPLPGEGGGGTAPCDGRGEPCPPHRDFEHFY